MQMRPLPLAAALAVSALLSGCNSQPENITAAGAADPDANAIATAPPVKLPPAMVSSQAYRCKDNSLVYIDIFADNVTAMVRKTKEGDPTPLAAPAAGQPYVGGGYTVSGTGKTLTVTQPGGSAQACKA